MADTARAYYDTLRDLAGDPARRARAFAGKVREDLRSGTEGFKSGAEQLRGHGSRTAADIGRLVRAEMDAGLTRLGVATQADLDDLNLRLEHSEDQIRELRIRLAEAEAAVAAAETEDGPDADSAPPSAAEPRDGAAPRGGEGDA
jgi:BMFP domain-containing protein YqiC